jgi:anti-sigma B factor antagonist
METASFVSVQSLAARLDRSGVAAFRREMQLILRTDQPRVVLDFCSVTHLDSAGVECLLHCLSAIVRKGGELKLAALSPQAAVILEMSRVSRFFEMFATVEDAIASFDVFVPGSTEYADPWNTFSNPSDGLQTDRNLEVQQG